jgi:hypothetical protein
MMGYAALYTRFRGQGIPAEIAKNLICYDVDRRATHNGVPTYNFLIPHKSLGQEIPYDLESPYDMTSIMQYESEMGAEGQTCPELDDCPMVAIERDGQGAKTGVARIPFNWVPSAQDVAFVRKYYPWMGWSPGFGPGGQQQHGGLGTGTHMRRRGQKVRNAELGWAKDMRNRSVLDHKRMADGSASYIYRVRHVDGVSGTGAAMAMF